MRRIEKHFLLFIISVCIILSMPAITRAEDWGWYNDTNISYPAYGVECGIGGLSPDVDAWFCWLDYANKTMDHSFLNYSLMDAYYNGSDGLVIGGNETYSLTFSAHQDQDSSISSGPGLLSGIFAYIRGLFL